MDLHCNLYIHKKSWKDFHKISFKNVHNTSFRIIENAYSDLEEKLNIDVKKRNNFINVINKKLITTQTSKVERYSLFPRFLQ